MDASYSAGTESEHEPEFDHDWAQRADEFWQDQVSEEAPQVEGATSSSSESEDEPPRVPRPKTEEEIAEWHRVQNELARLAYLDEHERRLKHNREILYLRSRNNVKNNDRYLSLYGFLYDTEEEIDPIYQ